MNPVPELSSSRRSQASEFNRSTQQQPSSLRKDVEKAMQLYFANLGGESVTDLYQLVLHEVEGPLLEAVLRHTGSNQSKASIMLGLNRGTLRKKLKQHGML
ncbi:MAG: DNA-binding transcriptional regulator Fis [Pseudomonadales bacterium]|nr:DNA-binding transcriptional regulator Fis [Pseudomonadales bacterium]MCP5329626.1 DNA-binding transcriptional regulator Fis [Pseudomonadales bacterium]MCP5343835.1 DNA-binding transcriptional regulator Fis [Pseudomonadales bacterium]